MKNAVAILVGSIGGAIIIAFMLRFDVASDGNRSALVVDRLYGTVEHCIIYFDPANGKYQGSRCNPLYPAKALPTPE